MNKTQKILVTILWAVIVVSMVGIISVRATRRDDAAIAVAGSSIEDQHLPAMFDAPAFSLTDQNGKTVGSDTLRGRPYVVMLFFSRCAGPCPMMIGKMAALQRTVTDANIRFVSFTVDPEHDTPAVLKQYAAKFDGDASRWALLTGDKNVLFATARGFKLAAIPAGTDNPIVHAEKFLLVDAKGVVRGVYESTDDTAMTRLTADAHELATMK